MSNHTSSTLMFILGGLAGAGAALLLAPQSGKATREAMRIKLREGVGSARHLRDQAIRRGEQVRDEAVHRVRAAASALAGNGADLGASV